MSKNNRKTAKIPAAPVPFPVQQLVTNATGLPDDRTRAQQLIAALEQLRKTRVIVYWLPDVAKISEAVAVPLYDVLSSMGKQPSIDLVLHTKGGDTEAPWRIVSLLREYCDRLSVLIPHRAHSAGTALALGANEIVMTPLAVLGPIDPSRTHPLLPRLDPAKEAEPISVQDMRHAMQFIREAASDGENKVPYTAEAMAQIFTALFEKLHPLAIGAIEQSYALSKLIATRALGTHMDPQTQQAEITKIVDTLCDEYKSHAYQICRSEARGIGLNVVDATPQEEVALMNLLKFYVARPIAPQNPPNVGQTFTGQIAWLDATHMNMRVEAIFKRVDAQRNDLVVDTGWKGY